MLPAILPLFPLPRVVLFPQTFLPLHIFEPRYRQMTAECLASHKHFILALTRAHEGPEPVPEATATFNIGCLARIVRTEPLPDGRFNLLVQGRQAVLIHEEPSSRPFRQARWESTPFDIEAPWPEGAKIALHGSLLRYSVKHGLEAHIRELLDLDLAPPILLNTLGMALDLDPVEKQFLLEAQDLSSLGERLHQVLEFALNDRGLPSG